MSVDAGSERPGFPYHLLFGVVFIGAGGLLRLYAERIVDPAFNIPLDVASWHVELTPTLMAWVSDGFLTLGALLILFGRARQS